MNPTRTDVLWMVEKRLHDTNYKHEYKRLHVEHKQKNLHDGHSQHTILAQVSYLKPRLGEACYDLAQVGEFVCTRQLFVLFLCCGAVQPMAEQLRHINIRISQLEGDKQTVLRGIGKCDILNSLMRINEQLVPL